MFKNFSAVLTRDGVVTLINFVISIILANYWDKNVVGIWFSVQAIFFVADSLFRYKSETLMLLLYKSGKNKSALGSQFVVAFISIIIFATVSFFVSSYALTKVALLGADVSIFDYIIFCFWVMMSIGGTTYLYYCTRERSFTTYNLLIFFQATTNLVLIVLATYFQLKSLTTFLLVQCMIWLPVFFNYILALIKNFPFTASKEILNLFKGGSYFYFSSIMAATHLNYPRLYATYYLTKEDVAEIGFLFIFGALLMKVPAAVNVVFLPEAKEGYKISDRFNLIKTVIFLVIAIHLVFAFLGNFLVTTFLGQTYYQIGPLLANLIPAFLFYNIAIILSTQLNLIGNYKAMLAASSISLGLQVLISNLFSPSYEAIFYSYYCYSITYLMIIGYIFYIRLRNEASF